MRTVLITGGSGFFGQIMCKYLTEKGFRCINIDLVKSEYTHKDLISYQDDIRNKEKLDELFSTYQFDAVFHFAAMLAHEKKMLKELWTSNVDGTQNIMDACIKYNIRSFLPRATACGGKTLTIP